MKKHLFVITALIIALASCKTPVTPEPDPDPEPPTQDTALASTFLGSNILEMDALLGSTQSEASAFLEAHGWTLADVTKYEDDTLVMFEMPFYGRTALMTVSLGSSSRAYCIDFSVNLDYLPDEIASAEIEKAFRAIGETRTLSTGETCSFIGRVDWDSFSYSCSGTYSDIADDFKTENSDYSYYWGNEDLGASENVYYEEYLGEGEVSGIAFEYSTIESDLYFGIVVASKLYRK